MLSEITGVFVVMQYDRGSLMFRPKSWWCCQHSSNHNIALVYIVPLFWLHTIYTLIMQRVFYGRKP